MLNNYLELNFAVLKAAASDREADGNDIRLVNLGPIGLFINYKLTTSSGKHLEETSHTHTVSLMNRLLASNKDSVDLSIGFDHSRDRRKQELTNTKNITGKYHLRIYFRVILGFAGHQETASYGLGYKLTLTRNNDNAVISKGNAINNAKIKINALEWYVPYFPRVLKNIIN